ncbi:MAG: hypothetical protein KatS3mg113_0101 [Planctomycetaceae bacterium]|nr:MAG: hypothetical protein KatS3mg113_0101 [Planctomycetaceae bacterium]
MWIGRPACRRWLSGCRVSSLTPRMSVWVELCLLLAVGCGGWTPQVQAQEGSPPTVVLRGQTMGTTYAIKALISADKVAEETLQRSVEERLEAINQQMSHWLPDSELSQFNRFAHTEWFAVSRELAAVVHRSIEISRGTEGAFDVTVAPLVAAWQFGPDAAPTPPDEQTLQAIREYVGWERLEVRLDPPALRKRDPRLRVDLSGIAKGYAVDAVAELLMAHGASACLVEIGGEVRACGERAVGPWNIGIESPVFYQRRLQRVIRLHQEALATSGDYRNFHHTDGKRVAHIIDPRTGRPVSHSLASASVLAPDCMTADALATAFMVMGTEAARLWAEQHGYDVLLIERGEQGFQEYATPGFTARYLPTPADTLPPENMRTGTVRLFNIFVASLVVIGLAVVGMAAGLLMNKPLRGSCGGLAPGKDADKRLTCIWCAHPDPACTGRAAGGTTRCEGLARHGRQPVVGPKVVC